MVSWVERKQYPTQYQLESWGCDDRCSLHLVFHAQYYLQIC